MDDSEMQLDYEDDSTLELESPLPAKKAMDNLKICIENEEDPDPSVTFIKMEADAGADVTVVEDGSGPQVKVNLTAGAGQPTSKYHMYQDKAKLYENKATGDFACGVDITSEDAKKKRRERAKRFGVQEEIIEDKKLDITALYASLGVTEEDLHRTCGRQIRPNAIMLRGVDNLNTQDIFMYFSKHPPKNLEWVDDTSCNVVFSFSEDANRALISMSEPIRTSFVSEKDKKRMKSRRKSSDTAAITPSTTDSQVKNKSIEDDDAIDLLSDLPDSKDIKAADCETQEMEVEDGELSSDDDSGVYMDESEVPPGRWRVAVPCSKIHTKLFMRLATKADVKVQGAERKSKYYRKHGNPNYGGLSGLISKSRKHRFRMDQDRLLEQEAKEAVAGGGRSKVTYDSDDLFGETYEETGDSVVSSRLSGGDTEIGSIYETRKRGRVLADSGDVCSEIDAELTNSEVAEKKRKPTMKMAADEEEEKVERVRAQSEAIMAAMDIRNKLNQKQIERYSDLLNPQPDHLPIKQEPVRPDLRSRLSRRNDW